MKFRRQLFEPLPGQRVSPEEAKRIRDEELAQFATAFGAPPPTE